MGLLQDFDAFSLLLSKDELALHANWGLGFLD